jgi:hypothetical protein
MSAGAGVDDTGYIGPESWYERGQGDPKLELDEIMDPERLDAAAEASLQARRALHQPMLYQRGEWMVLEHGDGSIEPIARVGEFRAEQILSRV